MKWIKIHKYLCLLFVAICSILFTTSLTAFAVRNEGSMEVIAHIETAPDETTQPVTDSTQGYIEQDESNISTGEAVSVCAVISSLLLIISVLVIYFCTKNGKRNSIHNSE